MSANTRKPRPGDRVAWRHEAMIFIACDCTHMVSMTVGRLVGRRRLPERLRLGDLEAWLVCSRCGKRLRFVSFDKG